MASSSMPEAQRSALLGSGRPIVSVCSWLALPCQDEIGQCERICDLRVLDTCQNIAGKLPRSATLLEVLLAGWMTPACCEAVWCALISQLVHVPGAPAR